ncbi:MAG: hypothetical protein QM698_04350 [Micropepsaceae bacterium]
MRLFAAAAFAALAATPALAAEPVIEKIEAKLFLSDTAALSDNVAEGSGVTLWNTIIGEGGAGPASDALIIVTVRAEAGSFQDAVLNVEITGHDGKPVASRKVQGLLIGADGTAATGIYVEDASCNALTIKASIGASTMTSGVPFACGE